MRRRAAFLPLVVAALALLPSSAAAAPAARLTSVGEPTFPERAYALTLPAGRSAEPGQVTVKENGDPVARLSVAPAHAAAAGDFAVVLVIDASLSMKGGPIRDAMVAARKFARRRSPRQALGVVTFNSRTSTPLDLTTDRAQIDRVLAKPPVLRKQTHVYDAVKHAVGVLRRAGVSAGSVVVLSDGGDTGSAASLADVAKQANRAGVRLFSVGLATGSFEPGALRDLARRAGGTYSEAREPRELARIYDDLGERLAREHLIQYDSLQPAGRQVRVRVSVAGAGAATISYVSPPAGSSTAPPHQADFWGSTLATFLVSLLAAGLLVFGVLALLRRPGRRDLGERVAMFVSPRSEDDAGSPRRSSLAEHLARPIERSLGRLKWWSTFKEQVDVAGIQMAPVAIVVLTLLGAALLAWIAFAASGSALTSVALLLGIPLGVRALVQIKLSRQRKAFAEQLGDTLSVIASALRAGHSFIGALTVAVEEAPDPTKSEFSRVLADEQVGVPLEEGLGVVSRRMESPDLEQVRLVATLQRETGGNTAEVLDRVAETVRERGELRRLVASLTAQGRMSRWIVTALPIVLVLLINLISPEYMKPLWETTIGHVMLGLAAVMLFAGSQLIKRIVAIKV